MSMEEYFHGRRVLVTGASRGLGRALVEKLHKYGAKVYALSATGKNLEKLKQDFPGIKTICVDISDWDATRKAISELETIDCVINNAAKYLHTPVMTATPEDFDTVYFTNTKSLINICQILAKKLIEAGKSGSIVNVTSTSEARPLPFAGIYASSKAAVEHMSKSLALELGASNIRVNTVAPAFMETDMAADCYAGLKIQYGMEGQDNAAVSNLFASRTPLPVPKTMMPLDKVANSILFLLSDLSGPVTGQRIVVDGGYLLS